MVIRKDFYRQAKKGKLNRFSQGNKAPMSGRVEGTFKYFSLGRRSTKVQEKAESQGIQ